MPSGDAFEYKYVIESVIINDNGEVRWESGENRIYTPEGGSVVLDDGPFNGKRCRQGNHYEHQNCTKEGFKAASSQCTPQRHFTILSDVGPGSRVRSSANMGAQTAW